MTEGLVSVVIPVFNRPAQLREAVASALAQEGVPLELLIVDDGSTDDTAAVAHALAASHPQHVRVLTQRNAGPGPAREQGRLAARGEFIQYLDSDDVLLPGKFAAQVAALRANPGCGVAYGMTCYRDAQGRVHDGAWKGSGSARDAMFPSFLVSRWWDTPTPLYRRSVTDAAGPWTDLRLEEDWEYDCRVAALGTRLAWCPQFVAEVRDHEGDRLCRGEALDARRLEQRARSHTLIYAHARRAGIDSRVPEMQAFARSLFLLARQCGAAGLASQSEALFELAREAAGQERNGSLDFRLYGAVARTLGWRFAGRASAWMDSLRSRHA